MTHRHEPRRWALKADSLLPASHWLRHYDTETFRADLKAGLVVAIMLVPQAMAYASLAGLAPIHGLYAAMVPVVVYALLGTSRQLAVGPVAIVSLLTAAGLAPLSDGDPLRYAALAATLAIMVGVFQIALGILKLGSLTNLLSHPVLSGFTSGAAVVIGFSQAGALLGLDLARPDGFVQGLVDIGRALASVDWLTVGVGAGSIVALVATRRLRPRFPAPLLVVGLAIVLVSLLNLDSRGVAILGEVPSGLPAVAVPPLDLAMMRALLPTALAIALIGYTEGISIAKAMGAKNKHLVDPNQELVAVGAANVAAGLFQAFPVAGGFSRTAVNNDAGARTALASIVTAGAVGVSIMVLTPAFHDLPKAVLGAIIVVAVGGLVDVRGAREVYRVRRRDGVALIATFVATLLLGVEVGIIVGVSISLALFVYATATPHMAELGRVSGTSTFRSVERYDTVTDSTIAIIRVDGSLYFANASYLRDRILRLVASRPRLSVVLIDASAVADLDASAAHRISTLIAELDDSDIDLHLTTVRGPVREVMDRSGLWALLAPARVHADIDTALGALGLAEDHRLRRPLADEEPLPNVF